MLDEKLQNELIRTGRTFMKGEMNEGPYADDFESDQDLKKPQPPLVKARMTDGPMIPLPREFDTLELNSNILSVIYNRKSSRVYTQESMSLLELSFLLWATQGVKGIRGKNYATLRTVPCGGARHEYETYLAVRKVDGLEPGIYHYLPMEHALEFIKSVPELDQEITESLDGQSFGAKANVVFYWAMVAYRAEWRYGILAHRVALIDAGHIGQNLYIGCSALGLGVCGIAAFSHKKCCGLLNIDGEEEYVVYTAPVGTVKADDKDKEQAFYSFLDEE